MTRVLISEFETIVGLGIREVLSDEGCEIIARRGSLTRDVIHEVRPDALVIDMDDLDEVARPGGLINEFPGIPLVACSSSDTRMRVFPAYRFGESYDAPLSSELLIRAVTTI